jgi:hypothetical protein
MISPRREALAALASVLLSAAFEAPRWQYRAPILVPAGAAFSSVRLTPEILVHTAPNFEDVRLVRNGEETPFVLVTRTGSIKESEVPAMLIDKEVSGDKLRFTLDAGSLARHSRIRIATPKQNFRQQVKLETSEDTRRWVSVRDDAWIFDFHRDGKSAELTTIDYPASTRRYLRVSIFGWNDPGLVSGASVFSRLVEPAERTVIATVTPEKAGDSQTGKSLYTLDVKAQGMPHDGLVLETGDSFFHRAVEVETSEDAKNWHWRTSGTIYRLPGESSLQLRYPETRDRYIRVRVFDHDNRPIAVRSARVEALNQYIHFYSQTEGNYWVYFGNTDAQTPSYDLPLILARRSETPSPAAVGPVESNPEYQPPAPPRRPWTERYPALLYTILVLAVAGMGYAAFTLLRKVLASPPEG